ncbi:flagellar hook-length control protein [Mycobacterium intracellulare]|uniref:flagellar hook-length control protein n=1 Tax=Mycobacterium intracellulare TaxID=1767 RepID=UPI000BAAFB64|nr:flagellar hook-length control protein [Mycobacterium intracellulare]ASW84608.1 flagellar hook-length control protein [Mycobacterium intracellulare]
MTTMTPEDAIKAAASVARDVADGKLSPSDLQAQAVAECRELFGTVVGEGDALWSLHADVARQAVGLGALSPEELREWAAVLDRQRGVEQPTEPLESPGPHDDPLRAVSLASVAESEPESTDDDHAPEGESDHAALQGTSIVSALAALASTAQQAHAEPAPQRRADSGDYDPLRGFNPGATRRR